MTTKKLSFREYLDSKDTLREAVENIPRRSASYVLHKYCKLVVGESKEEKIYVPLKPRQKVLVDWLYEDADNPTPIAIKFDGVKDVDPDNEHDTFWEGSKLLKWLLRNAREEKK